MKLSLSICALVLLLGISIAGAKGNNNNPVPVNVRNTPLPVNVQNQVPVNVQNQVVTRNANEPGLQPYSQTKSDTPTNNLNNVGLLFDVPSGKRLIIESVTVNAQVPTGQNVWLARLDITNAATQTLTLSAQGPNGDGADVFNGTHFIRAFADAGPNVQVIIQRNSTSGSWYVTANVTGYLIDLPASN